MMAKRRGQGRETWNRLKEWDQGSTDSERLSGHILSSAGYKSIDPSQPLGGPDSTKDMICTKDRLKWIGACYFAYGHKSFSSVKKKFLGDLKGVAKYSVDGIAFVTNQKLTVNQRQTLKDLAKCHVDILHLETITLLLNSPINYGIREDFLDIQMTEEENLSFTAARDKEYLEAIGYVPKSYVQPDAVVTNDTGSINVRFGEIWIANLGNGLRGELLGTRPVIIVSNDLNNKFAPTVAVVPLTTQIVKKILPIHVELSSFPSVDRPSVALVEQIKTISKLRLKEVVATLDISSIEKIKDALMLQLGLIEIPIRKE
jgi:mRNA-degrading endonuclease toxin of MazEF toxin-antitoxin module